MSYIRHLFEDESNSVTVTSGGTTAGSGGFTTEVWTVSSGTLGGGTGPMFQTWDTNGTIPTSSLYAIDPAAPGEIIEIIGKGPGVNEITVRRGSGAVAHAPNFTLQPYVPSNWYRDMENAKQRYSMTIDNQYTTSTTFQDVEGLCRIPFQYGFGFCEIEFFLAIKADPVSDIQTRWVVPPGSWGTKFVMGPTSVAGGFTGQGQHDARMSGHALTTAIPYQTYTSVNDNHVTERALMYIGYDENATGGFVSLQFAALNSGGTGSGIGKGSYVRWRKVQLTDLSL